MTPKVAKLITLQEELGATENEYWNLWAKDKLSEDDDKFMTSAINRLNSRIDRIQDSFEDEDWAALEIIEDEKAELEKQKERLFDKYNTDQPAHIADFWQKG